MYNSVLNLLQNNLENPLEWFGIAACLLFIILSMTWYFCEKIKNATFVDLVWAASFGALAIIFCFIGLAPLNRKILLLIATIPWSLRLFIYLLYRTRKKHPKEDARYAELRAAWGNQQSLFMFFAFQFQGLLISLLSLPIAAIAMNKLCNLLPSEILGAIICLLGFAGESIADQQKLSFISNGDNQGKVCNVGLWKYSRHPNYFFEWTVWLGIFIIALSATYGITFAYCPILMLYVLTQLSGVKLAERHSVQSRGKDYLIYQQTTSSFIPWFKLND